MKTERAPLIPLSVVAEWLDVSPDLVYRLCRDGRLPGIKVGGLWRFRESDVDRYIDSHTTTVPVDEEFAAV